MHRAVTIVLGMVWTLSGCSTKGGPAGDIAREVSTVPASAAPVPSEPKPAPPAASSAAPKAASVMDPSRYAWLSGTNAPAPVDTLEQRFATPPGFSRVDLVPESFGAFLRALPLAAPGTPVRSNTGAVILAPSDRRLSAVVAIDVGAGDLQQCADSVIRMHAEWRWARGRRDHRYRTASGLWLGFEGYARGERIKIDGDKLSLVQSGRAQAPTHALFRAWLDDVFGWANTGSLSRDATPVKLPDLGPGDFFVMPGGPGHAVLVLDMARDASGRRKLLLGQGYMPAQSFQVLRAPSGDAWFDLDEAAGAIDTPFWRPFPFDTLRRLGD